MEKNNMTDNMQAPAIDFSNPPQPGGSYVAVNIRDNIAYVAIQFPIKEDKFFFIGRFGDNVATEEGYQAARLAAINVLAQINKFVGFDNVIGLNHADIYYQASGDWDEGPRVANGASDLFLEVLGERGKHTRAIFGVERLPRSFSVALTASFTIIPSQAMKNKII